MPRYWHREAALNFPDDWSVFFRRCTRGHLWHESEGRECGQCSNEESDREQKREYWPLNEAGFTMCPDLPGRERDCCETCGWPAGRHTPF
ncbi:MAG: hypothetical protein AMXMBFR64_60820 [Myxococcales bacterium]